MIGSTINVSTGCHPLTHPQTPKSTAMVQRILGHFQNKVSNLVVKVGGEWGGVLFCGKTMVKISQWFHTLLCILNALKHQLTNSLTRGGLDVNKNGVSMQY